MNSHLDILLGSQTRSMYEVVLYEARLSTVVRTLTHALSQPLSFWSRTVILRWRSLFSLTFNCEPSKWLIQLLRMSFWMRCLDLMLQTLLVLNKSAKTFRTSASKCMHKGSRLLQYSQSDASSAVSLKLVVLHFSNSRSDWMAMYAFVDGSNQQ